MISYIEYLNVPIKIAGCIIFIIFIMQIIGEILELKGKIVPEIFKIRKYFARKKKEKDENKQMADWMKKVNQHMIDSDKKRERQALMIQSLSDKLDANSKITLSLLIDSKKSAIIDFASHVIDEKYPVTREQFKRIFKVHKEYEDIIEENGMTNGETDIAYRIITESYETHMRNHSFVEDLQGYTK